MAAAVKETVSKLFSSKNGSHAAAAASEPSAEEVQKIRQKYAQAGQEQVFAFWDSLNGSEKASLFAQVKDVDPQYINELVKKVLNPSNGDANGDSSVDTLPASKTSSVLDSSPDDLQQWYESGLDHVAHNKVGVVLMAGGQGTRLGSSAPKGCYDIGLESHKSLFQLQAERILKVQQLAAKKKTGEAAPIVPWYVMTSGPTRGPTEKYFEEMNYFGLKKENVFVFEQGVLPCIDNNGKIILESKSKVRRSQ
jgi:UDP-N-acetylglucosamine/UDP-N-acetylgalactosamine diphosphorylase